MGKHMRHKSMSIPQGHPGCMWGFLHVLKYQHWHWRFIKKRLPYKKHGQGDEGPGVIIQASDSADDLSKHSKAEVPNSKAEGKKSHSCRSTKGSVKSKLKALITEEKYKAKRKCRGRHHRSSTYPAPSTSAATGSVHHEEVHHIDELLPEIALNDERLAVANEDENEVSSDSSTSSEEQDQVLPKSSEEPITSDEGDEDDDDDEWKSPHHESTEDICQISKPMIAAVHRADGVHKLNQANAEMAYVSSGTPQHLNQSVENQVAKNRFKHLKQNIKHAIKESKKERHRIAMDAVLHKIPHKKGFSKDIFDHFKNPPRIKDVFSEFSTSKKRMRHNIRSSSFNESMDRYKNLYEISVSTEAKDQHNSKRIQEEKREEETVLPRRNSPKSLARILSSPELHYFYQAEDSPYAFSNSDMPTTAAADRNGPKIVDVSKALDHSSQEARGKTVSEEKKIDIKETLDESGNLMIGNIFSEIEPDSKPGIIPILELEEPSPVPLLSFSIEGQIATPADTSKSQDLELKQIQCLPDELDLLADVQHELRDIPKVAEDTFEFVKVEALKKDLDLDIELPEDTTDKDKYTYVRDVLELSGFSGNEPLGTWYADDQPLDPSMYESVRGCIFCNPDCFRDKEVGYCNHPLLFDLINEVLIEVYERSYSYCPRLLSPLCHIRPMPVGRHVLKEVWGNISWYLSYESGFDKPLDYVASRDLNRNDGWMNLQFENECLGLEVEELIFEDLLEELIRT